MYTNLHLLPYLEVEFIADNELVKEVGARRHAVKITETFHKGLDSKVGAAKVGDPIKFKYPDRNS